MNKETLQGTVIYIDYFWLAQLFSRTILIKGKVPVALKEFTNYLSK
jgi:hypothetical protein